MNPRTSKCSPQQKPAGLGCRLLILCVSCSLIWVGSLVWINNSIAIIPDNDPTTSVSLQSISGFGSAGDLEHLIQSAGHDFNCGSAQGVVRGNGDQDDNREECFELMPLTKGQSGMWSVSANYNQSRQISFAAPVSKVRIEPKPQPGPGGFVQRRTAVAYKDFGHLKVMAAEGGDSDISTSVFNHKEGHPCIMGGLSYWRQEEPTMAG